MPHFDTQGKLLLKGDFSGIQEFIFNIPSKKAAKTLKGKSFYVQALSWLAINDLKKSCKGSEVIYDGGGNFFMLIPTHCETILVKKQESYLQELANEGLTLILTWQLYDDTLTYGENLQELNKKAQLRSLNKFQNSSLFDFFEPMSSANVVQTTENGAVEFDKLGEWVIKSSGCKFEEKPKKRGISKLSQNLNFVNGVSDKILGNTVNGFLPLYDRKDMELIEPDTLTDEKVEEGAIMTFEHIAFFAAERTGTDNLGILSLDVDSLGHVVRERLETIEQNVAFSNALTTFFENNLWKIISTGSFETVQRSEKDPDKKREYLSTKKNIPFNKTIYPVFVGGDDCFLVGAWDAIWELTSIIKQQFDDYVKQDKILESYQLTFSAGLVMVSSNFPVNQFANLAKDALYQAKKAEGKNSVSFMGYVLSWEEWSEIVKLKQKLLIEVIEYDASKGMLNRFKAGKELYEQLQHKILNKGTIELSAIADFYYGLRDYKPKEAKTEIQKHKEAEVTYFIQTYNEFLTRAFIHHKAINSLIIPLAARWVEFLTRNKNGENK